MGGRRERACDGFCSKQQQGYRLPSRSRELEAVAPAILADRLFQDQPLRLVYVSPVLRTEQVLPASLFVVDVAFRIRLGSPSSLLLCTYHRFLDGFHCVCVCVRAFAKELCSETPAPSLLQEG